GHCRRGLQIMLLVRRVQRQQRKQSDLVGAWRAPGEGPHRPAARDEGSVDWEDVAALGNAGTSPVACFPEKGHILSAVHRSSLQARTGRLQERGGLPIAQGPS